MRRGIFNQMEVVGARHGYQGLLDCNFIPLDFGSVGDIIQRGGTMLQTARCESFKNEDVQRLAIEEMRKAAIEGLVVIGGDG